MRIDVTAVSIWVLVAATLVAVYYDVTVRRIPNWLTGLLVAVAVALHALGGLVSLGIALAVIAVTTVLGTFVYSRGGIGGGDIKLGIAGAGVLSFPLCIPFLLYTMIGGGLLALYYVARNRNLRTTLSRIAAMTAGGNPLAASNNADLMPYAIAFAFGALIVALSQSYAPFLRITV